MTTFTTTNVGHRRDLEAEGMRRAIGTTNEQRQYPGSSPRLPCFAGGRRSEDGDACRIEPTTFSLRVRSPPLDIGVRERGHGGCAALTLDRQDAKFCTTNQRPLLDFAAPTPMVRARLESRLRRWLEEFIHIPTIFLASLSGEAPAEYLAMFSDA